MRKLHSAAAGTAGVLAAAVAITGVLAAAASAGAASRSPAARGWPAARGPHHGAPRSLPGAIQPGGPMLPPGAHTAGHGIRAGHLRAHRIQPGGPAFISRRHRLPLMSTNSVDSLNWGGYAAYRRGVRFRYVSASFFVPYLDCTATPDAQSAHWVGLDGLHNPTVEQAGISANCKGTRPIYRAWYEMVPQNPVYVPFAISPGDAMTASVYFSKQAAAFTLRIADVTTGRHISRVTACPGRASCARSAAEAISEPPLGAHGYLPFADFRAMNYSNIQVTDQAGQRGGLRSRWWDTEQLSAVSKSGALLDRPTSLHGGHAFGLYWLREK